MDHKPLNNIILLDDDDLIRETMTFALESMGYHVSSGGNGAEGLTLLNTDHSPPSLILLDLMMPVMDGWHFAAAIRENPALAKIPIVVVSATDKVANINCAAVLKKPINLDELFATVDRYCHVRSPA